MCGIWGDGLEGPASLHCVRPGLPVKKPIIAALPGMGTHPPAAGTLGNGAKLVIQTQGLLISKVLGIFLNHKPVEVEEA